MPPCRCWAAWTTRWRAVGRPELGDHQLVVRRRGPRTSRQVAWRRGEADGLGVDVGVGDAAGRRPGRCRSCVPNCSRSDTYRAVMARASSHTPVWVAQTAAIRRSAGPRDDLGALLRHRRGRASPSTRDAVEAHGPLRLAAHRDLARRGARRRRRVRRGTPPSAAVAGARGDEDGGGPVGADHERLLAVEAPPVAVGGRLRGGHGRHRDVGRLVERER